MTATVDPPTNTPTEKGARARQKTPREVPIPPLNGEPMKVLSSTFVARIRSKKPGQQKERPLTPREKAEMALALALYTTACILAGMAICKWFFH